MSETRNEQNENILKDSFEGNESEVTTDAILNENESTDAANASEDVNLKKDADAGSDENKTNEAANTIEAETAAGAGTVAEDISTKPESSTESADMNPESVSEAAVETEQKISDAEPSEETEVSAAEPSAVELTSAEPNADAEGSAAVAGAEAPVGAATAAGAEQIPMDEAQAAEEKKKKRKKIFMICGGIVAAIAAIYCIIAFTYKSKFTTGTVINGIDASGMTVEQYEEALAEKVESYVLTMKFRENKSEKIKGTDVEYTYVADDGAKNLLANQNIFAWARGYFGVTEENTVNEGCEFDEAKLTEMVKALPELQFENMEVPTNAHLGVDEEASEDGEKVFEIVPETYGTQLIPDTFAEAVVEAAKSGVQELDVDESGLYVEPAIYSDDQYLHDSIDGFNEFLSTSVTYDLPNGEEEVLDASVLKNWIAMREDGIQYIDENVVKEHVDAYVALLAMKVDDVHHDRVLHSTLQGDVSFASETWGHMIDQETESAALLADIQNHNVTEREPAYSLNSSYAENFGYTYIEVDIENQTCFYYEDGELMWSSECVTGTGSNPSRETVRGIFTILNKQQGRTLRGEQLEDGSYTYESYVNYWMQFYEGYGLHDATWRSSYEFGGETYWYEGSHGCVNLPYYAAESLYFMVSKGTYVLVF